jgi:ubiquinone/menaquinone biosynthesis C-methylase UbiE
MNWKKSKVIVVISRLLAVGNAFVLPSSNARPKSNLNEASDKITRHKTEELMRNGGEVELRNGFDAKDDFVDSQSAAAILDELKEITTYSSSDANNTPVSPGLRENDVFRCDESVWFWKDFYYADKEERLKKLISDISSEVSQHRSARTYFVSHLLRTGYFTLSAALAVLASDAHERFFSSSARETTTAANEKVENDEKKDDSSKISGSMVDRLLGSGMATLLLEEAFHTYLQDYKFVKKKLLTFPWDAAFSEEGRLRTNHRQMNPTFAVSEILRTMKESAVIMSRRRKLSSDGVPDAAARGGKSRVEYPEYYLNDFHYQTDGWLSEESARRYEASTETLFVGRQDAMQRSTLVPLVKQHRRTPIASVLEVACGTGRLGTFLRDNLPSARVTYSDLSPYYLDVARENDDHWRSLQNNGVANPSATFVQANAERLPFASDSFDAVTCTYLFHELPPEARERAAREMVRVVRPGGIVVLTDSVQMGDRPNPNEENMKNFSNLNEPYYSSYVDTYLPDLFHGCDLGEKYVSSQTKTLSFVKRV